MKINAFVEPNNPNAVFPQIAKPNIMDFRSHKMALGGTTAMHNFRKIHSALSKKSKYPTIVKTTADLEREALEELNRMEVVESAEEDDGGASPVEMQYAKSKAKKDYSIADIMELESKLSINKKKPQPKQDQSKPIQKKEKKKYQTKRSK